MGLWIISLLFIVLKSNPKMLQDLDFRMEYVRTPMVLATVLEFHVKLIMVSGPLGTMVCHVLKLQMDEMAYRYGG
jgi:hypothetical protein